MIPRLAARRGIFDSKDNLRLMVEFFALRLCISSMNWPTRQSSMEDSNVSAPSMPTISLQLIR